MPVSYVLKLDGSKLGDLLRKEIPARLEIVGSFLESEIKRSFRSSPSAPGGPPGVLTGRLRDSIEHEVEGNRVRIGTNVPYGVHLELGTHDYEIVPKREGGVLVFQGKDGNLVFVRRVHHPGIRPRPFLRPALLKNLKTIKDIMLAPIER